MSDSERAESLLNVPVTDRVLVDLLDRRLRDHALRQSISIAPEPARPELIGQLNDLERRLASLVEATQKAQEPLSLDLMLTRLVALISEAFDADRSTLFLYDAENDEPMSQFSISYHRIDPMSRELNATKRPATLEAAA